MPSSLTRVLSFVLGFSPRPPASVCGTGTLTIVSAFSCQRGFTCFPTFISVVSAARLSPGSLSPVRLPPFPTLPFVVEHHVRVPAVLSNRSTGISTCCPSATTLVLALGPDSPRADQLYPGNLGYSATRIPTLFSLLIPAFSLPYSPQLLSVLLPPVCNAPLPTFRFLSFGDAFQPRTFSAQDLSTSELLRTL